MSAAPEAGVWKADWTELDHAPPPGLSLRRLLDAKQMSQRELATRTGLTPKHVNQVLAGTVTLSADVAERLSLVTGVPAHVWNRLEADHRSVLTKQQQGRNLAAERSWLNEMPINEMVQRSELPLEPSDPANRALQLLAYFGVASPSAWRDLWLRPNAALRQSRAFEANSGAVAAWIRAGQLRARDMDYAAFDPVALRNLLPQLRALTMLTPRESLPAAREALASVGVAVVYLRAYDKSRLNGATTWAGSARPAILLSGRYQRDDILFFTLFHEIGHLLLHGRKDTFVTDRMFVEGQDDAREVEADQFAGRTLIPPEFDDRLHGITTVAHARDFASEAGIGPSIVIGRLCREYPGAWPQNKGAKVRQSLDIQDFELDR